MTTRRGFREALKRRPAPKAPTPPLKGVLEKIDKGAKAAMVGVIRGYLKGGEALARKLRRK